MRGVVGLLVVGVVAVVAASTLGTNDGLVSFYWRGWRADLSLNFFLLLAVVCGFAGYVAVRSVNALIGLPERAREWRGRLRERAAQQALRESLGFLFAGRYSRAHRSAQRALDVQSQAAVLQADGEFAALSHLLAAASLHRLQDRTRRDNELAKVDVALSRPSSGASVISEGASLLAAEWALDDRDAPLALQRLAALPTGVARRTHAMRLKLQAARLAREPLEALKTARLLAKHQGFAPVAAQGLMRALATEALDQGRDAEQLRRIWLQLDAADRRDPLISAHAAERAASFGASGDARGWLKPHWSELPKLGDVERHAVLRAFVTACVDLPVDWLPLLEASISAMPVDPHVGYAVGMGMAQRSLWGRAAHLLEGVVRSSHATPALRRDAWLQLAQIAEREGDDARAQRCYREIAQSYRSAGLPAT